MFVRVCLFASSLYVCSGMSVWTNLGMSVRTECVRNKNRSVDTNQTHLENIAEINHSEQFSGDDHPSSCLLVSKDTFFMISVAKTVVSHFPTLRKHKTEHRSPRPTSRKLPPNLIGKRHELNSWHGMFEIFSCVAVKTCLH